MGRTDPRTFVLRAGERLLVRTAEPDDATALVAHERHMLAHNPFKVREADETDFAEDKHRENIREHLEGDGKLSLIALDPAGAVVGRLTFRNGKFRKMAHHGYFGIAVNDGWRGRGVGRSLITTLLDWASAHPTLEKVELGVFAGNTAAIGLYRSMGFVEQSRTPMYFKLGPGRYEDDIQMCIWVKPGLALQGFNTWPR